MLNVNESLNWEQSRTAGLGQLRYMPAGVRHEETEGGGDKKFHFFQNNFLAGYYRIIIFTPANMQISRNHLGVIIVPTISENIFIVFLSFSII